MGVNAGTGSDIIRQRIVGVLVLAALGFVFIPMLIDFRKDYDQLISDSNIPPKPEGFEVEILRLDQVQQISLPEMDVRTPPATDATGYPSNVLETARETYDLQALRELTPKSAPDSQNEQGDEQTSKTLKQSLPEPSSWVVQLASFNSEDNAITLRNRLQKKGFAAFVKKGRVDNRPVFRVQVGPELAKRDALRIRDKVAKGFNLEGVVIIYR